MSHHPTDPLRSTDASPWVTVHAHQETVELVARGLSTSMDSHQAVKLGDVPSIRAAEEIALTLNAMWEVLADASSLPTGPPEQRVDNSRLEALLASLDDCLSLSSRNSGQILNAGSRKLRLAFISLTTTLRTCRGIVIRCRYDPDMHARRIEIARLIQVVRDAERNLKQTIG